MTPNDLDLLPIRPKFPNTSERTSLHGIFKNILICFIVLFGIFIFADRITECWYINQREYKVYDDFQTVLYGRNPKGNPLHAEINEEIQLDTNSLKKKIETAVLQIKTVDAKIRRALDIYDADKLALYDYAAEYAGGKVVSTPNTLPYPSTNKVLQLGFFEITLSSNPTDILRPSIIPGDCFQFYGSKGRIIIKLGKKICIGSVSLEHSSMVENFLDAPKDFNVFGLSDEYANEKNLLGSFKYDIKKQETIQNYQTKFLVGKSNVFEYVELEILSNNGNELYTTIYRFRVHMMKNSELC